MKVLWVVLVMLFILPAVSALTLTPLSASISSPEKNREYSFIATVINDESTDLTVQLGVDPKSFYFAEDVTITPESATLAPDERVNVNIELRIPADISPEEHRLYITPTAAGRRWSSFEVLFTIPGEQHHNLTVTQVTIPDTTPDETTYVTIHLRNYGNVIARATPRISVLDGSSVLDTVEGRGEIMVMPGGSYNVSILYDPSGLDYGGYTASVYMTYNGWRNTNTESDAFQIVRYKDLHSVDAVTRKTVNEGERLEVEMTVSYAEDTEYSLEARVENTDIELTESGQLRGGEQKVITFELPTEMLAAGEYTVSATVSYGPGLGQKTHNSFELVVRSSKSQLLQTMAIIAAGAILLGLLVAKFIFADSDSRKKKKLLKKIALLEQRYNSSEQELKGLIRDVNHFVADSNAFFAWRFRGKYEFD